MANRLMLIAHLMTLAEHPALCGDDRTVRALHDAAEMLHVDGGIVERDERRRAKDRARPPRGNRNNPRISKESTESVDASNGFPHTPFLNSKAESSPGAREVEGAVDTALPYLDLLRGQMGDTLFPDADAFVRRRPARNWSAWLREMLSILTGGKATADDLAQVCRDDAALERPIGSPHGLRAFVGNAVRTRLQPPTENENNGQKPGIGGRAYLTTRDAIKDM